MSIHISQETKDLIIEDLRMFGRLSTGNISSHLNIKNRKARLTLYEMRRLKLVRRIRGAPMTVATWDLAAEDN